jgi:predicted membrane-bound spermidine synthase
VTISVPVFARALSFTIGLLSLGTETLWVRTYGFLGHSTPKAMALVLGVYLIGIAMGADVGARLCDRHANLENVLAACLLTGSTIVLLSPIILSASLSIIPDVLFARVVPVALAFMPAFVSSICFPICHHLGTALKEGYVGRSMSQVYAANIAGSVTGPLLVNFGILQFATTQLAFSLIGLLATGIAIISLVRITATRGLKSACTLCALLATGSVFLSIGPKNWLINSLSAAPELQVRRVVETRQGIVVSYQDDKLGDAIFGGNVYDGRANVDPRINSNGINRVLVLAALRPKAKRVLVIGLSIGSWLYLIEGFPGVEDIDVIEIIPAYLDLITDYKKQNEALDDPRVRLHIADGRKFLRSVPVGSYDLIIMNTTWHWRAYTSMLLSQEFLRLLRSRMTPDGLAAFNTTDSPDALYTAASVFPHAYLYDNFAVCASFDWRALLGVPASVEVLLGVKRGTTLFFSESDRPLLSAFLSPSHIATADQVAAKTPRPLEIITDRNLITEYRYGR